MIVDESKIGKGLGPGFPIPVEITPFCHGHTLRKVGKRDEEGTTFIISAVVFFFSVAKSAGCRATFGFSGLCLLERRRSGPFPRSRGAALCCAWVHRRTTRWTAPNLR